MKKIIFYAISLFLCLQAGRAQTLAAWNFESDTNTTVNGNPINNNPAPSTTDPYGTASAGSIGMGIYATPNDGAIADDIDKGGSSDTGANGVADKTETWRIRAQGPNASGANPSPANGWSSLAPIGTQGAVFSAPTTGVSASQYTGITVTFDWYSTTQGEANLALEYTTDGTNYTDIPVTLGGSDQGAVVETNSSDPNLIAGSYVNDTIANTNGGQDWFTGLTATITNPAIFNDPNFAIEMVNAATGADDVSTQGTALNNSSGNWRFDNVSITLDAAPEPSTWAMLIGGVGALALVARLRRLSA